MSWENIKVPVIRDGKEILVEMPVSISTAIEFRKMQQEKKTKQ